MKRTKLTADEIGQEVYYLPRSILERFTSPEDRKTLCEIRGHLQELVGLPAPGSPAPERPRPPALEAQKTPVLDSPKGRPPDDIPPSSSIGYVKLHRKLTDHPLWTALNPSVLKVAIAFLLSANWKSTTWYDGAREVEIPRGSFVTSYASMAKLCHLTLKQIRTSFQHLQNLDFAAYSRAPRYTIVSIRNYTTYQAHVDDEGRVEGTTRARRGHDKGTILRKPITKENKNSDAEASSFDHFWSLYPRRVGKQAALKAWRKHYSQKDKILEGLKAQLPQFGNREIKYIPHPATWLNQERWNDEPEPAAAIVKHQDRHEAHKAARDAAFHDLMNSRLKDEVH